MTGNNPLSKTSASIKTFFICFAAVIWRRTLIVSSIYSEHNKKVMNKSVLLKCLKYNIYGKNSIGGKIKPYITKAIEDEFLMPKFYKENKHVETSVMLFKEVYEIVLNMNRKEHIEYINNYGTAIFEPDGNTIDLIWEETKEIMNENSDKSNNIMGNFQTKKDENKISNNASSYDLEMLDYSDTLSETKSDELSSSDNYSSEDDTVPFVVKLNVKNGVKCSCALCKAIESWDIQLDLIWSDDSYKNILIDMLYEVLLNTMK